MTCGHEQEDGAYVLGALSSADRSAFERHLTDCAPCSAAVAELAGLPGLLARVSPEIADPVVTPDPAPSTLLPGLVRRVQRDRRRRAGRSVALVVSAAAVAMIAFGFALHDRDAQTEGVANGSAAPAVAMRALGDAPVAAEVSLTSYNWGTRLELTCDERNIPTSSSSEESAEWATYAVYVHTRNGPPELVASWRSVPGKVVHVSGAVATDSADIVGIDVRNAVGTRVLGTGR